MPLRGYMTNVYHTCSRCGTRRILADMRWQNGILVCNWSGCVDTAIVGSRDLNVAREVAVNRKEMQPDEKLVNPIERRNDQTEILY